MLKAGSQAQTVRELSPLPLAPSEPASPSSEPLHAARARLSDMTAPSAASVRVFFIG